MKKNKSIRMEVYQSIKKDLNNNRAAIKIDEPTDSLSYSITA
jgi:hypothetical protein